MAVSVAVKGVLAQEFQDHFFVLSVIHGRNPPGDVE
jgi:hypothetical protein